MLEPSYPQGGTKIDIVLQQLISATGNEVEAFSLASNAHSLAVHSVVSKLRTSYGWNIINRREHKKHEGRSICYSFYSLPTDQLDDRVA